MHESVEVSNSTPLFALRFEVSLLWHYQIFMSKTIANSRIALQS